MENLIDGFASLPGIGRKSAQRLAFHVLSLPQEEADRSASYPSRAMCSASSAAGNTTAYTMCSTALSRR